MKSKLVSVSLLMVMVLTGCGGDTRESLAEEGVSAMKDMVATLDNVKDEASAKANKDKLKSIVEKLNSINERQAKLPAPTEAEIKALGDKYGKQMEEIQQKLMANMMRVQFDPKIAAVLNDIDMKKMH